MSLKFKKIKTWSSKTNNTLSVSTVLTANAIPILYNNFQTLCEAQQEQPSVSHTVCERAIEILFFLSLSFPPPILHTEAQEVGWRPRPILFPPSSTPQNHGPFDRYRVRLRNIVSILWACFDKEIER